jgi:hypothetical protein
MAQDSLIAKLRRIFDPNRTDIRFVPEGVNEDNPEGYGVAVHDRNGPHTFYTGLGVSRVGPIAVDEASLVIDETSSMFHVYMHTARRSATPDVRIRGNNNTVDLANIATQARFTLATITGDENNFLGSRFTDDVTIRDSQSNRGNLRGGNDRLTVDLGQSPDVELATSFVNYSGGNGNDTLVLSGNLEGQIQFRRHGDGIAFYRSVRNDEGQEAFVRIGTFSEFETIEFRYEGQTVSRSMQSLLSQINDEATQRSQDQGYQRYEVLDIGTSVTFGQPVMAPIAAPRSTGREVDA